MGFGPGSSDSKSSQKTTNVSGQGQNNQKSSVAQGGSVLIDKGASIGGYSLKGVNGDLAITNTTTGTSPTDLKDIIGSIIAAAPAPNQAAGAQTTVPPPGAAPAAADWKKYLPLGLTALALLAGLVFLLRKR